MIIPSRTIRIGGIDYPVYSRGRVVARLIRGSWSLMRFVARYFRHKGNTNMFGSYTSSPARPRLVWSNPNFVTRGRSLARLRVIEGGKGKPPAFSPPLTALPAPEAQLCLPPPSAPSAPVGGPQPRPGLPPYVDPSTYW